MTVFAHGLDAFHKSHVAHNDSFASTCRAGSEAVERKQLYRGTLLLWGVGLGFAGEKLAYGVGDAQVGGGGAAEVYADVFLSDEDGMVSLVLQKMFHQ